MRKYPIGLQSFKEIITGGYVYVDKTALIHQLVSAGKYYFLSRPRRFGKSLLVSTLQTLYEGRKDLFEGLYIADKWDFSQTNPVVVIYFNQMSLRDVGLKASLITTLKHEAERHQISLKDEGVGFLFQELIQKLHAKTGRKVVVLIDEYDKAIVDYLEELETAEANRNTLKSFYGILKPADEHLELVLLTGVSKFAKVSVFSDLNNLNDISLDKKFASIAGITQIELETSFAQEITNFAQEKNSSQDEFLANIKHWYNGYSWGGAEKIYNPFSLLNFFSKNGDFQNYWFSTGTPTWLVKELQDKKMYDVEGIQSDETILSNFDYYHINPSTLLFQTGYLTIKHYDTKRQLYTLGYPNEEVRVSFMIHLSNAYRSDYQGQALPIAAGLEEALNNGDVAEAMQIINVVFSTIPYDLWQRENEHFYHALIHLTFTLLGVYVQSEVHTSRGRCDAVVQTKDYIYAFEFKLDKTAQEALDQIAAKGYLAPYAQSGKQRVAVGANFSTPLKAVESWLTAEVL